MPQLRLKSPPLVRVVGMRAATTLYPRPQGKLPIAKKTIVSFSKGMTRQRRHSCFETSRKSYSISRATAPFASCTFAPSTCALASRGGRSQPRDSPPTGRCAATERGEEHIMAADAVLALTTARPYLQKRQYRDDSTRQAD
eukprot:8666245-Pyramimonas_sp.AAC.1